MGSVYSIHSQMKFKDKNKAIKILQEKIGRGKEEHIDYGLDTYRKSENLDINDIDDLIAVFIGIGKMFDVANDDDGWTTYDNGFDASYGWESVMMEMFKELMKKAHMYMGGTNYAPVLKEMVTYYKDIEPSEIPAFIIFITDGENSDTFATNAVIKELSEYNIFVQFIGIGDEDFDYLKSLDGMEGRKHDNTGFTAVKDMNKMTDEQLYTEILRQYKDWLNKK